MERKTSNVDGEEFTMDSGSPAISSMAEEREESIDDVRREGMSSSAGIWYSGGSERARRCSCNVNSAIAVVVDGDGKRRMLMAFEVCFRLFCFVYKRVAKKTASKQNGTKLFSVWVGQAGQPMHIYGTATAYWYKYYCDVLLRGISLMRPVLPIYVAAPMQ